MSGPSVALLKEMHPLSWAQKLRDQSGPPQVDSFGPCGCIGPQNGQPLCQCQMRGVSVQDGRYVRVQDLGAAT